MKVTVEIDCTPDEARQFMGLPDVKPLQAAVMAKLEQQMLDAVGGFAPEALLKTWLSLVPQTPEQFRELTTRFFRMPMPFGTGMGAGGGTGTPSGTGTGD